MGDFVTRPNKRRLVAALAAGTALAFAATGTMTATAASEHGDGVDPNTDATRTHGGVDQASAIVQLSQAPLATSPRTAAGNGKPIAFRSAQVKNERAKLAAQRNAFKRWLRDNAPDARVTSEYDVAVNAVAVKLNGTSLATLRSAPNVVSVSYEALYTPTADDPDLSLIDATTAWETDQVGGYANAGAGVQVGIVDTGIDINHPCFDDEGFDVPKQLGDHRFTNNKVIVAKVFANKAANLGYSAEAVQDHGTHVAGTVACDYQTPATVNGVDISTRPDGYAPSGVAPAAQLGSYNVFPGDIENARSEDILNALQAAAEDGMDVINMSLGGGASGVQDLLTMAVDNLDRAGIVVAVSAGNEGPGHYTVGSPGSAERALTAGASSVGHFVGLPVSYSGTSTLAATGDFAVPTADLTAHLGIVGTGGTLGTGCASGEYPDDLTGKIALVSRGACTFGTKVYLAEQAGAVATIVVNNVAGDPVAMAGDGHTTSKPAVMVGLGVKDAMVAATGSDVTIGSTASYARTGNDNIMAGFSSQGPTDVDFRVKPDLVAPGVNVLSSIPLSYCPGEDTCWAFFQGTSMASPHLAGTAAVVRAAHTDWSAEQVRSAIVNTAQEDGLTSYEDGSTPVTDPQIIGAGLDDVDAAVNAQVALSSVSTSFGAVPKLSRKPLAKPITITDLTGGGVNLAVSIDGEGADAFDVSADKVEVPAGGSTTVTVTFDPTGHGGGTYATLRLGDVAHSVLYGFVK